MQADSSHDIVISYSQQNKQIVANFVAFNKDEVMNKGYYACADPEGGG